MIEFQLLMRFDEGLSPPLGSSAWMSYIFDTRSACRSTVVTILKKQEY